MTKRKCPTCGNLMERDRDHVYHCSECNIDYQVSRKSTLIRIILGTVIGVIFGLIIVYLPEATFSGDRTKRFIVEMALFSLWWYIYRKAADFYESKQELLEISDSNSKYSGRKAETIELILTVTVVMVIWLTVLRLERLKTGQ